MNKVYWLLSAIVLLLFGAGCSWQDIIDLQQKIIRSPAYLRMTKSPQALCSANDYATTYKSYYLETDLTDQKAGIVGNELISLDDESMAKFSVAVWWENCKRSSYSTKGIDPATGREKEYYHPACWAYFPSTDPGHKGYYRYYPNNTTDSDKVTLGDEIFYVPSFNKISEFPWPYFYEDAAGPLDYTNKIKIPGDFAANDYSALAQIKDLNCLEGLAIPATYTFDAFPSPGQPLRTIPVSPILSTNILYTTYPVIDLTALAELTNLRALSINNVRISSGHGENKAISAVPIEGGVVKKLGYSAIAQLDKLKALYMQDTDADGISFINDLTNLKLLDLSFNRSLSQIAPVFWIPKLEKLLMNFMPPLNLAVTASIDFDDGGDLRIKETPFPALKELSLSGTSVDTINALWAATDLRKVDLSAGMCATYSGGDNIVTDRLLCRLAAIDLGPLPGMKWLTKLDISGRYLDQADCDSLSSSLPRTQVNCTPDSRAKQKDN